MLHLHSIFPTLSSALEPCWCDEEDTMKRRMDERTLTCRMRCFNGDSVAREELVVARCRSKSSRRSLLLPKSAVGDTRNQRTGEFWMFHSSGCFQKGVYEREEIGEKIATDFGPGLMVATFRHSHATTECGGQGHCRR